MTDRSASGVEMLDAEGRSMAGRPTSVTDLFEDVLFDRTQDFTREFTRWLPPMRCQYEGCVFTFSHLDEVCQRYQSSRPLRLAAGGVVTNPRFRDGTNVMPR